MQYQGGEGLGMIPEGLPSEEEGCGEDCGGDGGQCQVFPESPPPVLHL